MDGERGAWGWVSVGFKEEEVVVADTLSAKLNRGTYGLRW